MSQLHPKEWPVGATCPEKAPRCDLFNYARKPSPGSQSEIATLVS
jgi:hypothetical protein